MCLMKCYASPQTCLIHLSTVMMTVIKYFLKNFLFPNSYKLDAGNATNHIISKYYQKDIENAINELDIFMTCFNIPIFFTYKQMMRLFVIIIILMKCLGHFSFPQHFSFIFINYFSLVRKFLLLNHKL